MGSALFMLFIAAALPAVASESGSVSDRIAGQQQLIQEHRAAGLITAEEAGILQYNLGRIAAREAMLKSSGSLSEREISKLHVLLDHNSDMLARKRLYGVKKLY
jgi:hypothetical protein